MVEECFFLRMYKGEMRSREDWNRTRLQVACFAWRDEAGHEINVRALIH